MAVPELGGEMKVLGLMVVLAALGGCGKKNPADQAAQDIKAMGEQRAKAEDTLKQLEESQNKAKEAADKAGEEKQ
jgi:outer membrane murein-binding lipoprotein Lpp